jgi:hypothetical protein
VAITARLDSQATNTASTPKSAGVYSRVNNGANSSGKACASAAPLASVATWRMKPPAANL